jgi:hypothetical protein
VSTDPVRNDWRGPIGSLGAAWRDGTANGAVGGFAVAGDTSTGGCERFEGETLRETRDLLVVGLPVGDTSVLLRDRRDGFTGSGVASASAGDTSARRDLG